MQRGRLPKEKYKKFAALDALQRSDSRSIAEGVRRSQSPHDRPPVVPQRSSTNGPHGGRKSVGFKPGGLSLAAGVKGAKNISEAPLMHVSNLELDHHERVSSYDSVESAISNNSAGGRSSDNSTGQFVGPLGTRPITQPARAPPPKHQLHIDSSSREQSSYNQDEVAKMLRQSYANRVTASNITDNTLDFTKEFTNSKVIPLNRLQDSKSAGTVEVDIRKNIQPSPPSSTNLSPPSGGGRSRDVTPERPVTTSPGRERSPGGGVTRQPPRSPVKSPDRFCQARYTFKAEGTRELSFKKRDIIRIRRDVDANWLEGELEGIVGIFPKNYVDILEEEPEEEELPEVPPPAPPSYGHGTSNYVPSYQRSLSSLPQGKHGRAADTERKAREEEEERARREEEERARREEEERKEEERRIEERRLADRRRSLDRRMEVERLREEERVRAEEARARRLEEERRKREEEELERRRREEEELERRRREEEEEERRQEEELRRREEEERRIEELRLQRQEEERRRREEAERERREEERRKQEQRRRQEEERRRQEEERRRIEEERLRAEEEERRIQEEIEAENRRREEELRILEQERKREEERRRNEDRKREEERKREEDKRRREEERLRELERVQKEEEERERRAREEEEERVREQNQRNHRISTNGDAFEVKAVYSFKTNDANELPFKKGSLLTVTEVIDENWYFGTFGARSGIFPSSYVTPLNPPPPSQIIEEVARDDTFNRSGEESEDSANYQDCELFVAQYNYQPKNTDELELLRGDIIEVIERCDDGWFVGTSQRTEQFGTFPGNYVKLHVEQPGDV